MARSMAPKDVSYVAQSPFVEVSLQYCTASQDDLSIVISSTLAWSTPVFAVRAPSDYEKRKANVVEIAKHVA